MDIDNSIIKVLWKSVFIYRSKVLNIPEMKKEIENDKNCESIEEDYNYWIMFYLIRAISEVGGFQMLYHKLIDGGCGKKKTKDFLYSLIKLNLKTEKGIFSWNEIEELNIDYDLVKKTTTKYKFF